MSRSQLRISVAAIRLTRSGRAHGCRRPPVPRSLRRGASGSPRKCRASRRCTASSPGQSASSRTVTAASAPACARRTRAARIALRAAGSPSGPCRASNSAAGSAKPASAGSAPHIARNCRWNARVVVDRRSCACSAGQEDRNGRLPYGRASEAPHRGQVRASRASWVGEGREPAPEGAGLGSPSGRAGSGCRSRGRCRSPAARRCTRARGHSGCAGGRRWTRPSSLSHRGQRQSQRTGHPPSAAQNSSTARSVLLIHVHLS